MSGCSHMVNGKCSLDFFGGRPSPGVCRVCPEYDGPSRGFGDTLKNGIKSVTGITKPCEGCLKRADLLNRMVPYT